MNIYTPIHAKNCIQQNHKLVKTEEYCWGKFSIYFVRRTECHICGITHSVQTEEPIREFSFPDALISTNKSNYQKRIKELEGLGFSFFVSGKSVPKKVRKPHNYFYIAVRLKERSYCFVVRKVFGKSYHIPRINGRQNISSELVYLELLK